MDKWTDEAVRALDEFLGEVERYAISLGDDAAEIVAELREHIVRETEEIAGEVITLDHLRRILATVGSPQTIIGVENVQYASETKKPFTTTHQDTNEPTSPKTGSSATILKGCCVFSVWLALVPTLLFGLWMSVRYISLASENKAYNPPALQSPAADVQTDDNEAVEGAVIADIKLIMHAQEAYRTHLHSDENGDGKGDYGTLKHLAAPPAQLLPPEFGSGNPIHGGTNFTEYRFTVTTIPGTAKTEPTYVGIATPKTMRTGLRSFYFDQSGTIRYALSGENVDQTSKILHKIEPAQ